jgi:hypothetical protein
MMLRDEKRVPEHSETKPISSGDDDMDQYEWQKMAPVVREKYLEIIRAMPLSKRFEIALDHSDYIRELMKTGIRMRNPGISEEDVRRELIRMTLPPDIVKNVYGWPEEADSDIGTGSCP